MSKRPSPGTGRGAVVVSPSFLCYFLPAVPFLTLEDPNAKIKGSRDPVLCQNSALLK